MPYAKLRTHLTTDQIRAVMADRPRRNWRWRWKIAARNALLVLIVALVVGVLAVLIGLAWDDEWLRISSGI